MCALRGLPENKLPGNRMEQAADGAAPKPEDRRGGPCFAEEIIFNLSGLLLRLWGIRKETKGI